MPLLYDKEVRVFMALCGSDGNNAYLIVCPQTGRSIMIDAPLGPGQLLEEAVGAEVTAVLITHRHRDHWEGLEEVIAATGAKAGAHADDAEGLPVTPNFLMSDGDIVRTGSIELTVIHTPGHTPGSVCLRMGRLLFTGDTLYAHAPGESQGQEATLQLLTGLTEKIFVLPDDTIVLPGHGPGGILKLMKQQYRAVAAQYPDLLPPLL